MSTGRPRRTLEEVARAYGVRATAPSPELDSLPDRGAFLAAHRTLADARNVWRAPRKGTR